MDAFVYRDGDDVPRDVTRVVVHPSVRVLPPGAFRGCRNLEEVQLNEGLEEIGESAFYDCWRLRCLNCPSTILRIGDRAFYCCWKLRRLSCPPTVVRIGDEAFHGCELLEKVQLSEGLKEIGERAFYCCVSLRRLNCPSTVVRMGARAFEKCTMLAELQLAGILKVEGGAFAGCYTIALGARIQVPSRAFVVQQGNYPDLNYTCRLVTDGIFSRIYRRAFALITPACLTALPESNLTELGDSISAIMNNGEGTEEDRLNRVRQEVRREVAGEVSAILGLAFWKAKIDGAERVIMGSVNNQREDTGGGRKRAKVGIVLTRRAREGCRGEGKGKVIAQSVLPFLDGLWCKESQGDP